MTLVAVDLVYRSNNSLIHIRGNIYEFGRIDRRDFIRGDK